MSGNKKVNVTGVPSMPPSPLDAGRLAEARHQLHSVLQWLARMTSSYREPMPGDDGLALLWDGRRRAITTPKLTGDLAMEVGLPGLVLHFTESGAPVPHAFETEEHSPAHVEAWILVELLHRGIDRERFSKALPYDVSSLMSGDATQFSPETHAAELAGLADWFGYAASILEEHASEMHGDPGATGLRIWPQDLSLEMQGPFGAVSARVRTGFSPGTQHVPEPYFYAKQPGALPDRTGTPDFILRASEAATGGGRTTVLDFLRRTTRAQS